MLESWDTNPASNRMPDQPLSIGTSTSAATVQDRPKGVVAPAQARRMFRMERYLPPPALAPFLDHVWVVEWDLGDKPPHVQRTLPYPCVHVVFDSARSGVWGVPTGAFDYELKGAGKVCGLRFRAGAFRALLKRPLHTITDQVLALSYVFPWDDAAAQHAVLGLPRRCRHDGRRDAPARAVAAGAAGPIRTSGASAPS